jgi:2-polyprenyl-3-methyl-5-hydroxy-6-metoxy-1,4-benzoquinol methylase
MKHNFSKIQELDEEITLGRNSDFDFWRILRKSQNYGNANIKTYGDQKGYDGNTTNEQKLINELIYLKENDIERFKPKTDLGAGKNNITDAPGFGSVRLSPPYEEPDFDKQYFDFLNNLIENDYSIVDFGGGAGHFLYMTKDCKEKLLVEKNNINFLNKIDYIDADKFDFTKRYDMIFSYHTMEHVNNPEELIVKLANCSDFFVFASPLTELIKTSIHHYIYIEISIIKKLLRDNNLIGFIHTSKNNLDVHCIIVKNPKIYNKLKIDSFFNKNFKLYSQC